MKIILSLLLLYLSHAPAFASESENWKLVLADDPLSHQSACLMVSATYQLEDGQTTTPVNIIYNGKVFFVKTKSNIDTSYINAGLQINQRQQHKFDRLHNKTNVIFEVTADQIRDQFIKGLNAKLALGFWPTWPKTRVYISEFNLRGFTKTYKAFLRCQKTGKSPRHNQPSIK